MLCVHVSDSGLLVITDQVNGVPIFVRGANVVSLDVLESRVTTARYRNLLESAKAAHFSIFRVNGDANYMKDAFYDICDEVCLACLTRAIDYGLVHAAFCPSHIYSCSSYCDSFVPTETPPL
jgi:hypothetical protein